jgi:hypothetical protein
MLECDQAPPDVVGNAVHVMKVSVFFGRARFSGFQTEAAPAFAAD